MHSPHERGDGTRQRHIGAVDIGGTKIAVGVVRDDGVVLSRRECLTLPENGYADALQRVELMLREVSANSGELDGIGVGCPGPLDPFSGTIHQVGTLPGWEGAQIARELQTRFGVNVAVENDADAAALAEFHWGSASSCSSFVYITVSTGIGGGIVLDGKLYRGAKGAHPEFGHHVLDASGPSCYCGARGCWESLASGLAMTAWMKTVAPEMPSMSASAICERATLGDPLALKAMQRQAHYLGLGLANIVTLFMPERIALGGGVMRSSSLFLRETKQIVSTICTQVPVAQTVIECAELGADVGLLGAAQCWLQRYR